MAVNNSLVQVITYLPSALALLQNQNCFFSTANFKFDGFEKKEPMNLGDTVSYSLPYRVTTANSLVASIQGLNERKRNLTVDFPLSAAYAYTDLQYIFNDGSGQLPKVAKSACVALGAKFEARVAKVAETNTFRFYGDSITPITTFQQLAQALAFFRTFGAAPENTKGYIADMAVPLIVNSGQNQFTLDRNNKNAMSWELGPFSRCEWYSSNLLPVHTAGTEGKTNTTLTVVSTTLNADGGVTSITFSGTNAASDVNSVKAYDKFQFSDGVSGKTNVRFLTFQGYVISSAPAQFAAAADAASTAGSQVTVTLTYPLQAAAGSEQNINTAIVAGMQVKVLGDHRCGLITSGDPLFCAMPVLPDEAPYPTARETDMDTGVSLRTYWGSQFLQAQRAVVNDGILGVDLVPEYSMMLTFPV